MDSFGRNYVTCSWLSGDWNVIITMIYLSFPHIFLWLVRLKFLKGRKDPSLVVLFEPRVALNKRSLGFWRRKGPSRSCQASEGGCVGSELVPAHLKG